MDIFLIVVASGLMILGIIGSFLPIIPGPITSWLGFLFLYFSDSISISNKLITVSLAIAIFIWILDYFIPSVGTKIFGGSKYGMIGTSIGLIVGLISPIPGGIFIGLFLGAFVGELLNKSDSQTALKAAFGSFLGFLASTFIKFVVSLTYFGIFLSILLRQKSIFL